MNRKPYGKRAKRRKNTGRNRVIRVVESRHNPSYPPQNNTKPICTRNLRYIASSAGANIDITGRCLLNLIVATSTATTTAINIYESVKLNRVSMYYVPSSVDAFGSSAAELILNWRGERSSDVRLSDRGTLSHPACIKSRPPLESFSAFWITNQSNLDTVLFSMSYSTGTVIDINLSLTIGDGATRTITLSAVGANSGLSYMALNNAIAAGTVGARTLVPDSLTTQDVTTP